jgi:hypothetical protein
MAERKKHASKHGAFQNKLIWDATFFIHFADQAKKY